MKTKGATSGLLPAIGDLVYLSPDVGYYGKDAGWWRVTGYRDALVLGHGYVTGWPLNVDPIRPQTIYVQTSGLSIRRGTW